MTIGLGSVVRLNSGSPEMTVVRYVESDYYGNSLVECTMFNTNTQRFETIVISPEALV